MLFVGHDVDHPGHTNTFEVLTGTKRALIYNDNAVLEQHHSYTTFCLLQQPESNVFENFPIDLKRSIRTILIQGILSTDMR
jgi:hypothetical protein